MWSIFLSKKHEKTTQFLPNNLLREEGDDEAITMTSKDSKDVKSYCVSFFARA